MPAILLSGSLETPDIDNPARANQVNLIGCDERFWQLGQGRESPDGSAFLPDAPLILNEPLASQLGVQAGDTLMVRMPALGAVPPDNPLGRKDEKTRSGRARIAKVIPADGLGRFSLHAGQQSPRNAYLRLDWLQDQLEQPERVNTILVAGVKDQEFGNSGGSVVQPFLRPTLDDFDLRISGGPRHVRGKSVPTSHRIQEYLQVTANRMILDRATEEELLRALRAQEVQVQPALTYLATTIACREKTLPYSTVTAIDFHQRSPLGPMLAAGSRSPVSPLGENEIALNAWAAEDLGARVGDEVLLAYFEPENSLGKFVEKTVALRLAAIVALEGLADDCGLTPEVTGLTDKRSISNWDPPFPFDRQRIRGKDDAYWKARGATPKAFVSLATGRRLWGSRFGQSTAIRLAGDGSIFWPQDVSGEQPSNRKHGPVPFAAAAEKLARSVALEPMRLGMAFEPVKRQGLAASVGATPFEGLFLGFSSFLIAAAVLLVALLFRLGVDQRRTQIGILLALGWSPRQVARLLVGEGLLVTAVGGLLGVGLAVGYAGLMLLGLRTWWLEAVATPFLELYVTPSSLLIGYIGGLVTSLAAIAWSVRQVSRASCRALLAGQETHVDISLSRRKTVGRVAALAWLLLLGAVAAGIAGIAAGRLGEDTQAAAFFGSGVLALVGGWLWIRTRLVAGATGPAVAVGRGNLLRLALRNAARHPSRSSLTVGMLSAACFLIVATSVFHLDPTQRQPSLESGNGGFALVAQSTQPIYRDLNRDDDRRQLGFSAEQSKMFDDTTVLSLRVRPGDDASCQNLYQPREPRILGVPSTLADRGGFAWADRGTAFLEKDPSHPDKLQGPWRLLETPLEPDADGVPLAPVILEKNTAMYSLHLWRGVGQRFEVRDARGQAVRLQVVALLSESLFQGDLLVSEADFLRHFPLENGYRFFLVAAPTERLPAVSRALEQVLGDYGLATETTAARLASFLAVQNTYLSTFQSLGGLGLLLGTLGLAAVQGRSVLERRSELALLLATGMSRGMLGRLVLWEHASLLVAGLACGVVAALITVLPHLAAGNASIPWLSLSGTLALVFAVGLLAGLAAVRLATSTRIVEGLRSE